MNTLSDLWKKLSKKKYREAFVASQLKRGIPFQIRSLRKQRGWSQADLAKNSGITQGVISRVEDPDYGSLTFNTILRIAAGFDVAFIGIFVPFSELGKRFLNLSEESAQVASFSTESVDDRMVKGPLESEQEMISTASLLTASSVGRPDQRTETDILGNRGPKLEWSRVVMAPKANTPSYELYPPPHGPRGTHGINYNLTSQNDRVLAN